MEIERTGQPGATPIAFDLEGPLAPQDNAYELMKLSPHGDRAFQAISRYDDLLALEGRPDYEPGDTLALIIPFLLCHGVTEEQIAAMGQAAPLTPGAPELTFGLQSQGWRLFCISTSYEQYALAITGRLGIPGQNVACTSLRLAEIRRLVDPADLALLRETEERIAGLSPDVDDAGLRDVLDSFYREHLPRTRSGQVMSQVKPVGGRRKVDALERFSATLATPLAHWVAAGDSITDSRMLQAVHEAGGLAVAFNANEYALRYATMGLASVRLDDLWPVLEAWDRGGRQAVEDMTREMEAAGGTGDREWFHWIAGTKDIGRALPVHKRIRRLVRKEAAKLG